MRLRRMGCEDLVLEGISPALRAMASDFSLRGQRKVTKRKVTLADSLSFVEYPHLYHSTDGTRRRVSMTRRHSLDILVSRPREGANKSYGTRAFTGNPLILND